MPYRRPNPYAESYRSTVSRRYRRVPSRNPRRRLPVRRPLALSGMTRTRRAFGYPVGHRRLPLPYLITKASGPTPLQVGGTGDTIQSVHKEAHSITKLEVDSGDTLSGVLLTVSLPSVTEGSIYVAEVLCTTTALTVGTTATMPQGLPYHAGSSTRVPTRLPVTGSTFSRRRFIAKNATTRTMYFRTHVTPDVGDSGRPVRTRIFLVEHMYGCISGERHTVSYIRTNVRSKSTTRHVYSLIPSLDPRSRVQRLRTLGYGDESRGRRGGGRPKRRRKLSRII